MSPNDQVVQSLLRLAVAPKDADVQAASRQLLESPPTDAWAHCLTRLDEHRLLSFAYFGLVESRLLGLVPTQEQELLRAQFDYASATNLLRWISLRGLVERLRERGIVPTVFKGVVLAQRYYPHPAARYMKDIDLLVAPEEFDAACSVLGDLGYVNVPETNLPDGSWFKNGIGVLVDLHHRMRVFENLELRGHELTELDPDGSFRVIEPHAMLAFLRVHYESHARDIGPLLCWLIDIALVVKKNERRLDLDYLRYLVTRLANWGEFLRGLRLVHDAMGLDVPGDLLALAEAHPPYPLGSLFRQRRLALWGLPGLRGWARLLRCAVRGRGPLERPWPSVRDLILWPFDQPLARRD